MELVFIGSNFVHYVYKSTRCSRDSIGQIDLCWNRANIEEILGDRVELVVGDVRMRTW